MEADVTDPKDRPEDDREREDQELDEALDETFPASDPPAFTAPGRHDVGSEKVKKPR